MLEQDFLDFVKIVQQLRKECPWDREQTHQSIRHALLEEAYETIEAIEHHNNQELKKELGDLMLHIVLHSVIAEETNEFTLSEVLNFVKEKLIRRHPHVFGDVQVSGVAEIKQNWERFKLDEGRTSILEGVPKELPSLQRGFRLQEKAAKVGFEWSNKEDAWKKFEEELQEFQNAVREGNHKEMEEEFGDLLFTLINYARYINVQPENALRYTNEKFIRRFQFIEEELKKIGKDVHQSNLEEMDALWDKAKEKFRNEQKKI
ncbi:MAG: nucleoside triphosphate pyrophosphohydrolase [Bacteroidota bacterium]